MKEHEVNILDNFIGGWYICPDLCDEIVSLCETEKKSFFSIEKESPTSLRNYFYSNFLALKGDDLRERYFSELNKVLLCYKNKYTFSDSVYFYELGQDYKIQFYESNQCYSVMHCENMGTPNTTDRHLVFMTYLNDIYDGGETEFFYQKIKMKPKKGLTLIWPSAWTHTHKGHLTKEKKYLITGWYKFKTK